MGSASLLTDAGLPRVVLVLVQLLHVSPGSRQLLPWKDTERSADCTVLWANLPRDVEARMAVEKDKCESGRVRE